jgi:hypothetical protein
MLVPGHIPRALRWPIFVTSPLLTLWNWNQAQRVYLVISRLGITYHEMGYSVRTSWDNIVHIGRLPGHSAEQGIWLRHPALVVNRRFRWLLAPGEIDGRFIPLDRFVVPDEMLAQPLLAAAQPAA